MNKSKQVQEGIVLTQWREQLK